MKMWQLKVGDVVWESYDRVWVVLSIKPDRNVATYAPNSYKYTVITLLWLVHQLPRLTGTTTVLKSHTTDSTDVLGDYYSARGGHVVRASRKCT